MQRRNNRLQDREKNQDYKTGHDVLVVCGSREKVRADLNSRASSGLSFFRLIRKTRMVEERLRWN